MVRLPAATALRSPSRSGWSAPTPGAPVGSSDLRLMPDSSRASGHPRGRHRGGSRLGVRRRRVRDGFRQRPNQVVNSAAPSLFAKVSLFDSVDDARAAGAHRHPRRHLPHRRARRRRGARIGGVHRTRPGVEAPFASVPAAVDVPAGSAVVPMVVECPGIPSRHGCQHRPPSRSTRRKASRTRRYRLGPRHAGLLATATPIPNATANPPTRPKNVQGSRLASLTQPSIDPCRSLSAILARVPCNELSSGLLQSPSSPVRYYFSTFRATPIRHSVAEPVAEKPPSQGVPPCSTSACNWTRSAIRAKVE